MLGRSPSRDRERGQSASSGIDGSRKSVDPATPFDCRREFWIRCAHCSDTCLTTNSFRSFIPQKKINNDDKKPAARLVYFFRRSRSSTIIARKRSAANGKSQIPLFQQCRSRGRHVSNAQCPARKAFLIKLRALRRLTRRVYAGTLFLFRYFRNIYGVR